jgi:hypothetical protein
MVRFSVFTASLSRELLSVDGFVSEGAGCASLEEEAPMVAMLYLFSCLFWLYVVVDLSISY